MGASSKEENGELEAVTSRRGGKDNAPSLSWFYGEKIKADVDVAVKVDARLLYRWAGYYWDAQTEAREERRALQWVEGIAPNKTTAALAKELAKTAVLAARAIPDRSSERVCIPLKNVYLHLEEQVIPPGEVEDDEGSIQQLAGGIFHTFAVGSPAREEWMTYGIDCALNDAEPGKFYEPSVKLADTHFGRFLETCQPDAAVRSLIQEYIGYTLLPDTRHQRCQLWTGEGQNGKSILTRVTAALHRKTASIDLDRLDGFSLEDLIDASLVICDEAPTALKASDRLKKILSGESVKIDRKFQTVISTAITAKWIICTNHKLKVSDQTIGFWRRIVTIPWDVQVPDDKIIVNLDRLIIDKELDVVLEWALEGLLRLLDRGRFPEEPEAVRNLKDEIRTATDSVRSWFKDVEPTVDARYETPKDVIYKHYDQWCFESGHHPVAKNKFFERLFQVLPEARAGEKQKRTGGSCWRILPVRLDKKETDSSTDWN